jgi:hypothetical protein
MPDPGKSYSNFKDAYCAVNRCPPEGFERHVFGRAVNRLTLPLAVLFGLGNRDLFGVDYETIQAIGASSTAHELQVLLGDFENRHLVERSFRRQTLGIRATASRLDRLFRPLLGSVVPPAAPESFPALAPASTPRLRAEPVAAGSVAEPQDSREGSTLIVRRLRRLHAEIVAGRSLRQAARQAGFEEDEVLQRLSEHKGTFSDLNWLESHLRQRLELDRLQTENGQLRRVVADLSDRLLKATGRV